jgi:hypothetical protein
MTDREIREEVLGLLEPGGTLADLIDLLYLAPSPTDQMTRVRRGLLVEAVASTGSAILYTDQSDYALYRTTGSAEHGTLKLEEPVTGRRQLDSHGHPVHAFPDEASKYGARSADLFLYFLVKGPTGSRTGLKLIPRGQPLGGLPSSP